jgi:NADH:ubiquinone oxidoreductase subunit
MTTLQMRLMTWLRGSLVGTDAWGNRYYRDKKAPDAAKARRWVIYCGLDEASKVPAEWYGWLHRTTDDLPQPAPSWNWQKPHLPNLTGTRHAYRPHGHILEGSRRRKATGDYEPWTPEENAP